MLIKSCDYFIGLRAEKSTNDDNIPQLRVERREEEGESDFRRRNAIFIEHPELLIRLTGTKATFVTAPGWRERRTTTRRRLLLTLLRPLDKLLV
jgi:hypothetical protein